MSFLPTFPPETIMAIVLLGIIVLLGGLGRYGSGE